MFRFKTFLINVFVILCLYYQISGAEDDFKFSGPCSVLKPDVGQRVTHKCSPEKKSPFQEWLCASIRESLLQICKEEDELSPDITAKDFKRYLPTKEKVCDTLSVSGYVKSVDDCKKSCRKNFLCRVLSYFVSKSKDAEIPLKKIKPFEESSVERSGIKDSNQNNRNLSSNETKSESTTGESGAKKYSNETLTNTTRKGTENSENVRTNNQLKTASTKSRDDTVNNIDITSSKSKSPNNATKTQTRHKSQNNPDSSDLKELSSLDQTTSRKNNSTINKESNSTDSKLKTPLSRQNKKKVPNSNDDDDLDSEDSNVISTTLKPFKSTQNINTKSVDDTKKESNLKKMDDELNNTNKTKISDVPEQSKPKVSVTKDTEKEIKNVDTTPKKQPPTTVKSNIVKNVPDNNADDDVKIQNPAAQSDIRSQVKKGPYSTGKVHKSGNFMTYAIVGLLLVIVLYVLYQKKNKIIGLIVEGRKPASTSRSRSNSGGRRSPSGIVYQPLPSEEKQEGLQKFIY